MTIAVLGLGGVGGMVAARTGALGIGTERAVAAVRAHGITLVHAGATTVTPVDAVELLETRVSLLVVAVKAPALEAALARVPPEAVADAVVLPLLNGLEHVELIRDRFPLPTVVAAGSIGRLEAFSPEPGFVVQRTAGAALVTAAARDSPAAALAAALAPLRVPGIDVLVGEGERAVLWEKTARLAVLAAGTSASRQPVGVIRHDPGWRARLGLALDEACAVAAADGVPLDPAALWAMIDAMPETLTTSTARDLAAGRPSELDAITGSVVRAGKRLGVPTPVLAELLEDACPPR